MNNKILLKQARSGIKALINESPFTVTKSVYPLVSDGFGGMVEDPTGTPVPSTIKIRISHERRQTFLNSEKPSGLSTDLQRFAMWAYDVTMEEGDSITGIADKNYRIGPVDPLYKFGGIIGYQAKLIEEVAVS